VLLYKAGNGIISYMKDNTKKEKKEKQLDFNLKNPPQNIYYKYKDQYEMWLAGMETRRFVKDVLTWFVIILSISLISTEIYMIFNLESLPSQIPVFNYFFTLSRRLVSNQWIYLYPAIGTILLILGIIIAKKYYHNERELARTLLIATFLANVTLCLIFLKLVYTF
jgi:hypothetical protein